MEALPRLGRNGSVAERADWVTHGGEFGLNSGNGKCDALVVGAGGRRVSGGGGSGGAFSAGAGRRGDAFGWPQAADGGQVGAQSGEVRAA